MRRVAALALGLACGLAGTVVPARAQEPGPAPLKVLLGVKGETVTASFDVTPALIAAKSFRRRLDGGLKSRVVIEMSLLDADARLIAYSARECTLRLDVWDERLQVVIRDGEQERGLKPFEDISRGLHACGEVNAVDIADLSLLSRASGYRLEVLVSLNPVSPELLERTREFLSNPRGGRGGRPRALFGAVSKLFSSGQGAGGDTFPFRSQAMDRPSVRPR